MKIVKYIILILVIFVISLFVLSRVPAIQDRVVTNVIKNVLSNPVSLPDDGLSALVCGSRSPLPSPGRAETCIIIKAGQNLYVVDIGDGSINNLRNWRVDLTPVKAVLFTHLHSDHISDLADLHLNTWVNNPTKTEKLKVYGPEGVEDVVNGFEDAYTLDYQFRNEHHGDKVAPINLAGYDTFTIDLSNPIIIDDNGLKVTAFKVIHDPIEPALGFRFDYKGRSIVISGDTISTENTIKNSINADVLFHEAQANHIVKILENENKKVGNNLAAKIMADIVTYHTTPIEAAEIANQANVKHLVFYHLTPAPRNALMERMFVRGVNDIRKEWTLSDDGTLVILPPNSEKIEITKIN